MNIHILPQPDDTTCGPTALHAVYHYLNLDLSLETVIKQVNYLEDGGTLAVFLGIDALKRNFNATIITYNLKIFDPSWKGLDNQALITKLKDQLKYKPGKKFTEATFAYIAYLENGGRILFDNLTESLLDDYFGRQLPILAGLSATYLYNSKREYTNRKNQSVFDDLKGEPMGHFVVLCGREGNNVLVADPYQDNPISNDAYYHVSLDRLLNAILLGIVTYDANLLIVSLKNISDEEIISHQSA